MTVPLSGDCSSLDAFLTQLALVLEKQRRMESRTHVEAAMVYEALKTGVDEDDVALTLVRKAASNESWALRRLVTLFETRKTPKAVSWTRKLESVRNFLYVLLSGRESGVHRLSLLADALVQAWLRPADVASVVQACLSWDILARDDVLLFLAALDSQAALDQRKHLHEGLVYVAGANKA